MCGIVEERKLQLQKHQHDLCFSILTELLCRFSKSYSRVFVTEILELLENMELQL
jgi:hypothetical protein